MQQSRNYLFSEMINEQATAWKVISKQKNLQFTPFYALPSSLNLAFLIKEIKHHDRLLITYRLVDNSIYRHHMLKQNVLIICP
jgi:hypothetical protein